jgi:hypothetical protein
MTKILQKILNLFYINKQNNEINEDSLDKEFLFHFLFLFGDAIHNIKDFGYMYSNIKEEDRDFEKIGKLFFQNNNAKIISIVGQILRSISSTGYNHHSVKNLLKKEYKELLNYENLKKTYRNQNYIINETKTFSFIEKANLLALIDITMKAANGHKINEIELDFLSEIFEVPKEKLFTQNI